MKSIRYHILRCFKLRKRGVLSYRDISKYFIGLNSTTITETGILSALITMEEDGIIKWNEKRDSYRLLLGLHELNIELENYREDPKIVPGISSPTLEEILEKRVSAQIQTTLTKTVKCPCCDHPHTFFKSKAIRRRKQCSKCGYKGEWKYWKKPDPISPWEFLKKKYDHKILSNFLELIEAGYGQKHIAEKLKISRSSVSRMCQYLTHHKIIECYSSYPKFYRMDPFTKVDASFQKLFNKGPDKLTNEKGLWPTSTTIHYITFKTPLTSRPKAPIDAKYNKKMTHWVPHLYSWNFHPGLPQGWNVAVTTKNVFWKYTNPVTAQSAQKAIDKLKLNIPYDFLKKRRYLFTEDQTAAHGKQHCVFRTHTKLDKMGVKSVVSIQRDGEEIMHADDSPGKGEGELETDAQTMDSILSVPEKLTHLQSEMSEMKAAISLLTQSLTTFATTVKSSLSPPKATAESTVSTKRPPVETYHMYI